MNEFDGYSDERLNQMATEFILGECWHELVSVKSKQTIKTQICEKCKTAAYVLLPNADFCNDIKSALSLVRRLSRIWIDEDFPLNVEAFTIHLKTALLPSGQYSTILSSADIFVLYLVKPRQIVEACLLGIDYKNKIGE